MKVFMSYRRDDTGGRAGRLYDALAQKYGQQRIFQDVSSATPGIDFTARIESTIATSDIVLVVIGPGWLSAIEAGEPGETVNRRIDRADDLVRREIAAALVTGKPVVPVLVDGATLPSPDDLPTELSGLVRRQAVTVHDTSWHQDVDSLIKRLEGEQPPLVSRRRTSVVIAGIAVAVLVSVVVAVLMREDDDNNSGDGGETPTCDEVDDSWTAIETSDVAPTEFTTGDHRGTAQVVGAWYRPAATGYVVFVELRGENFTEPDPDPTVFTDNYYLGIGDINGILIDGTSQSEPFCLSRSVGDQEMEPGENATVMVGFVATADPAGAAITLEAFNLDIEVTA